VARGVQVDNITVHLEGLEPLLAAFERMPIITKRELRRELLEIADNVAKKAEGFAVGQGLVDDDHAPKGGGLADRIKPRLSGSQVLVVDSARRASPKYPGGYPYPALYEFGHGGARAFMRPAVTSEAHDTRRRLDTFIARVERESGFQGA
jgi:hypothetical protein